MSQSIWRLYPKKILKSTNHDILLSSFIILFQIFLFVTPRCDFMSVEFLANIPTWTFCTPECNFYFVHMMQIFFMIIIIFFVCMISLSRKSCSRFQCTRNFPHFFLLFLFLKTRINCDFLNQISFFLLSDLLFLLNFQKQKNLFFQFSFSSNIKKSFFYYFQVAICRCFSFND